MDSKEAIQIKTAPELSLFLPVLDEEENLRPMHAKIRAALDELADFGRPAHIALAVLIDRGGRELPIQPDVVGKAITVEPGDRVDVLVEELDGRTAVVIVLAAQAEAP